MTYPLDGGEPRWTLALQQLAEQRERIRVLEGLVRFREFERDQAYGVLMSGFLRVPDAVARSLGPNSEPLWYAGALQTENGRDVETVPPPVDVDPSTLRATPKHVVSEGEHPDDALADDG